MKDVDVEFVLFKQEITKVILRFWNLLCHCFFVVAFIYFKLMMNLSHRKRRRRATRQPSRRQHLHRKSPLQLRRHRRSVLRLPQPLKSWTLAATPASAISWLTSQFLHRSRLNTYCNSIMHLGENIHTVLVALIARLIVFTLGWGVTPGEKKSRTVAPVLYWWATRFRSWDSSHSRGRLN